MTNGAPITLGGHDDPVVRSITFSPNSRWLVTTSTDLASDSGAPPTTSKTARLWDLQSVASEPRAVSFEIRRSFQRVWQVDFSQDSNWLLMRADTPDLRVWRMPEAGTKLTDFTLQRDSASSRDELGSAAFSTDGRYVAVGSKQGLVHIWSLDREKPTDWRTFSNSGVDVTRLAFSADSRMLFVGGGNGWIRVWPVDAEGGAVQTAAGHEGAVSDLRALRQRSQLLTASFGDATAGGGGDETVRQFRLDSSQTLADPASVLRTTETGLSIQQSPDRHWIAFGSGSTQTTLVRVNSGGPAKYYSVSGELSPSAFSSSGEWLATQAQDGVRLTNLNTMKTFAIDDADISSRGPDTRIVYAAFSMDSSRILVVEAHSAKLYDIKGPAPFKVAATATAPDGFEYTAPDTSVGSQQGEAASSLSLSPDGRWLLATCLRYPEFGDTSDPRAVSSLWDFHDSNRPRNYQLDVPTPHSGLVLSNKMVVSTTDGSAYLWNLPYAETQRPVILKGGGPAHPIENNLQASADGRWVVTLSANTAFVWNVETRPLGEASAVLGPFAQTAIGGSYRAWDRVQFSNSGKWLSITQKHEDAPYKQLWLLKLDQPRPLARLLPATKDDSFENVAFDEQDEWMATGGKSDRLLDIDEKDIKLWDLQSTDWGQRAYTLAAHESAVEDFMFVGRYLVSTAVDRSVVKWDVRERGSGVFLQVPVGTSFLQPSTILRSPNDETVLVVNRYGEMSDDYSIFDSYSLRPESLLPLISRVVGRPLTALESSRYLGR